MNTTRLLGWWRFAVAVIERLASPPADIARADGAAIAVIRDSRLFQMADRLSQCVEVSWQQSRFRSAVQWTATRWRGGSLASRIRVAGKVAFVAGITTILLQLSVPDPLNYGRPFAWALPLASALAGLCAAASAEPIARAWNARREYSRQ